MSGTISLLTPSRGRPARLRKMLASVRDTADDISRVRVWVGLDDDDQATLGGPGAVGLIRDFPFVRVKIAPRRKILAEYWNDLWEQDRRTPEDQGGPADAYFHGNDDLFFQTPRFDALVRDTISHFPDGIVAVHGDDGYNHSALATASFTTRRVTEVLGRFVAPWFPNLYCDTWITYCFRAVKRLVYLPHLLIPHEQFSIPGFAHLDDETYRHRAALNAISTVKWNETSADRESDIAKLQAAIDAYAKEHHA